MTGRILRVVVAFGLLAVTACRDSDEVGVPTPPTEATIAEGSAPPDGPGVLVSSSPVVDSGLDATVTSIRYTSEAVDGSVVEVTGLVAVPMGEAPAAGYPVLSWAHGTTGVADACAPSRNPRAAFAGLGAFVDAGFVVVATDYAGLGTPGVHPYLVSASEGRSVLDAVAALDGTGIDTDGRLVIAGASQGGHAALAAAEIAGERLPAHDLRGTIAMAPAADVEALVTGMFSSPVGAGFAILVAAGWADAYPELEREDLLGPAGLEIADYAADEGCVGEVFGVTTLAEQDELLRASPVDLPQWSARIAENDIDPSRVGGPVLLVHGQADEVIPFPLSEVLAGELCAAGVTTRFVPYPDTDHVGVFGASLADAVQWSLDRLGDAPAPSTCGAG